MTDIEEIQELETRIVPILQGIAKSLNAELGGSLDDVPEHLSLFVNSDPTAKFIYRWMVAASEEFSTGVFIVTAPSRLERLYLLVDGRTARDGQLEENGLFVFATDGGGSFFVFNVKKRSFHHVDMAGWCSPSEY